MAAPLYNYTMEIMDAPLEVLDSFPRDIRRQIGHSLDLLQRNFAGDVKKLRGQQAKYRLRSGSYRVLFQLIGRHITVYAIGDRKNIYAR